MAKPPKHLAVLDHSETPPQSGKVGGYFRSYEYISNQTTINHTRPTRGGTIRHHQIALEHHRKAERLGFGFLLPKTNITNQTGTTYKLDGKATTSTTHAQRGAERFYITRLLWCTHAKRKVIFLKKTNGPCN